MLESVLVCTYVNAWHYHQGQACLCVCMRECVRVCVWARMRVCVYM